MSEMRKGNKNYFYGKKMSKEHKEKLIRLSTGRPSWTKGIKLTEEHKSNLSKARSKGIINGTINIWNANKSKINFDEIFKLHSEGLNQKEISLRLQCDRSNISRILNNKYQHKMRIGVSKVSTK